MSPALVYLFISNLITLLSNSFTPLLGPGYAEGRLVYNVNLGVRVNSVLHANDGGSVIFVSPRLLHGQGTMDSHQSFAHHTSF